MTGKQPGRSLIPRACALALLALAPRVGFAQADTVTVTAGPRYEAGDLHEELLGESYRELWTTPIRVAVLDLSRYAGGLEPVERGGGEQTAVLHMKGADGRDYVFRSVNKHPSFEDDPALRGTVIQDIVQDQVSSMHPAAALVAAPLLEAAGVLHVVPQLRVMPDDPALGEFRAEFAGMLGTIEERANEEVEGEDDNEPGFAGFTRITGTERLLERREEAPDDRVDSRAFLRARLMDLFLGDWDRHYDQWRWGESDREDGLDVWIPIPRDRDFAFVDYDGLLVDLARNFAANAVEFEPDLTNVYGLSLNAQDLDRLLLAELPRLAWDSIAVDLQRRLTDDVIEAAVRRMPDAYGARNAEWLAGVLKARRADLRAAAARLYELHSVAVDVHATDADELAVFERLDEERAELRIYGPDEDTGELEQEPYFRRVFLDDETVEVRVYLHGGDDRAVVRGRGEGPVFRAIGGGGDDVMADSSTAGGGGTAFYDDRGDNRLAAGPGGAVVDTRAYEPPADSDPLSGQGFRDWGTSWSIQPYVDYKGTEGLILGGGPTFTRYGFRQVPFAYRLGAQGMVALGSWGVGVGAFGEFHRINSPLTFSFDFEASQLESFRFFGYGNDTPEVESDRTTVPQDQVSLEAAVEMPLAGGARLAVGPVVKYSDPTVEAGSVLDLTRPLGSETFGQAGAQAEAWLDRRDDPALPRRGFYLAAEGALYPGVWDAPETFGRAELQASTYLGLPLPLDPTLALRLGGERVWGEFPVHEAAFLGGSRSLRGYSYQRFAGDVSVYGGAELRAALMPLELIVNGDLGALALVDAGRVYFDGESDGGWHTGVGAGLWFGFSLRDRTTVASLVYAQGEKGSIYLKLGMPF